MADPVISFEHVSKSYPVYHHFAGGFKNFVFNFRKTMRDLRTTSFRALNDVNFTIQRGECVGIVGRNGAGKSTTLGMIAGVLKPNQGRVRVSARVSPLLELGGGFHPELTGRENILLNGVLMGLSRADIARKQDEIIEFSELGEFIEQPIRTYSSGMMSRLGFSVVANLDPEILLIDEVLAVGDMKFQQKCLERMRNFKKSGVTIVLVSHSPSDIKMVCDRVLWFENHELKLDGEVNSVMEKYIEGMK